MQTRLTQSRDLATVLCPCRARPVYLSVPLSAAGGGNLRINQEVAESIKRAVEKRFGVEYIYVLNPGTPDADFPRGAGGSEYMVMWTAMLEGADGLGDFYAAYFAGPQDFARFFGFDGNNDMAKLDAFFDKRVASDPAIAIVFDGQGVAPPQLESNVSEGYVGKCAM